MDDWFGLQRGLVAVGLLAAVPGCTDSDKDKPTSSDSGSTGDGGTTSSSSSTAGDTSGDNPTGTGSATGTTGDGSTSTTTTTTTTSTTGEPTTGVEIPPLCQSYGAKIAECYMDPLAGMDAEQFCTNVLMYAEIYGPDCAPAYEAYLACLSALPCAEFTGPDPCVPEGMAFEAACN
jgi:hypothetical protein